MTASTVTLIGTGALASLLGARISRAGHGVTLIGTWREALDAINSRGIRVEDSHECWSAAAGALSIEEDRPTPGPLVLVLVKSHRTCAVADIAALARLPDGTTLTLQNGLGNREILAAAAGAGCVAAGAAYLGATILGPAHVRDGGGSLIVLEKGRRASIAAEVFQSAGFDIAAETDIAPAQWAKLAVNCAVNPLTALLRLPNGAILDDAEMRATLQLAAREVDAVARALGIRFARDAAELALEVVSSTARNRSSMLQDIERGVATEIEALNGAVVREADRLGVPVPVNRRLLNEIRQLESRRACNGAGGRIPGGEQ